MLGSGINFHKFLQENIIEKNNNLSRVVTIQNGRRIVYSNDEGDWEHNGKEISNAVLRNLLYRKMKDGNSRTDIKFYDKNSQLVANYSGRVF